MNYRHAYHAGNFADVLKHAVLALVIAYMKRKPQPFRIIDTHAGRGAYPLATAEAAKTGEWRQGIGRLIGPGIQPLPADVARRLLPYWTALAAAPGSALDVYPGSPLVAQRLMRDCDTLIANEKHPEERRALAAALGRDRRIKVLELDGFTALRALLPPKERRAVVLIDPPFEAEDEFAVLAEGLAQALARFRTGVYLAWYPIKDASAVRRFYAAIASLPVPYLLVELRIARSPTTRLEACGLLIANPPYTLRTDLALVLPELTRRLAQHPSAGFRIDALGTREASVGRLAAGAAGLRAFKPRKRPTP
jgi:23S rRNA (adenine2030-N6)-methyltransferase